MATVAWFSNLELPPMRRAPVMQQSARVGVFSTSRSRHVHAANGYRTRCGSPVGAGQGGISTRWQGYENSLRVGANEPYIPSAEAVEFLLVALGQRVSA